MFEKLLEYQSLDGKIRAVKNEVASSPVRVSAEKYKNLGREEQTKLADVLNKAQALLQSFLSCQEEYSSVFEKLNALSKQNLEKLTEEQINESVELGNNLLNKLSVLERNLSMQSTNLSALIKTYESSRNTIMMYRSKLDEIKLKLDEQDKEYQSRFDALEKQKHDLEKQIDPSLLAKYKKIQTEAKFPYLVPLNNNACGGCSMELPAALLTKLKENGYLECEQCHRYIYLK